MRNASLLLAGALLMSTSVFGLGCVQQDRYDHLVTANRSLEEQIVSLEDELDAERGTVRTMQGQLSESRHSYNSLESQYSELNTSIDVIDAETEDYLRRIAQLELGPLPADVEDAITRLAMQYPNLLAFDARLGMLRFSSDLTFDLGSVELKPDAIATLETLASILTAASAANLEARVVGHTDNVPIRRAETRRLHPTNMHLSVHRAIAVQDVLVLSGVPENRILVAGFGDSQPIIPNGPRGAVENRRVEIFLAPMRGSSQNIPVAVVPETVAPMETPIEPEPEYLEPLK